MTTLWHLFLCEVWLALFIFSGFYPSRSIRHISRFPVCRSNKISKKRRRKPFTTYLYIFRAEKPYEQQQYILLRDDDDDGEGDGIMISCAPSP